MNGNERYNFGTSYPQGLSQDELAEKVMATRQAVSRWETGRTVPNTETLKLLSKVLDVSINALLGEPRPLICQCCGMPLEDDEIISRNSDGTKNEDYCKWCYADGTYTYSNMDELIDVCVTHMVKEDFTEVIIMARISGVDLPREKRVEIGLTYIYGIGLPSSQRILKEANVNPDTRCADLTDDEVRRLSEVIKATQVVEGDLRREIGFNIKRLQEIACYRGKRHRQGLPVRGQKTKTNARTRKGPKKTVANKKK